jgi:septal ring factor EnvC (AmiA/AmiB activator)
MLRERRNECSMEPMTPEERFTKIENFLNATAEHQAQFAEQMAAQDARHAEEMSELRNMQRAIAAGMIELQQTQRELQQTQRATEQELKTLAESTRTLDKELREAQKLTEEKLHILIETVDRIIREKK